MTAADPFGRQHRSADGAVLAQRVHGVNGTRGRVAAAASGAAQEGQERGERELVGADGEGHGSANDE